MNGLTWDLHDSPATSVGAIRLSAIIVLCVLAALFLREVRVEAAILPVPVTTPATAWWLPPPAVPNVEWERGSMADGLRAHSDVLGDRWQPQQNVAHETPRRPVELIEPAEVPTVAVAAAPAERAFLREPAAVEPPVANAPADRSSDTKQRVRASIAANDFAEALVILTGSPPRISDDPEHYALLSVVLVALRRFEEAAEIYTALLARDPHDARVWAGLAICQARLGRSGRSIDAFREAKRLASGDAGVLRLVESGLAGVG